MSRPNFYLLYGLDKAKNYLIKRGYTIYIVKRTVTVTEYHNHTSDLDKDFICVLKDGSMVSPEKEELLTANTTYDQHLMETFNKVFSEDIMTKLM